MKVFHIESGLGNQMLDYADMIASASCNNDEYYIETILYELGEAQDEIAMWNGYELERVFGLHPNNVKTLFNKEEWAEIIQDVLKSEFWNDGWTYSDAITTAFRKHGLNLIDRNPRIHNGLKVLPMEMKYSKYIVRQLYYRILKSKENNAAIPDRIYFRSITDDFNGHFLKLMYKGNQIDKIERQIRAAFQFPVYDEKNAKFAKKLKKVNSVAIHARRGDFLGHNAYCYKFGYFRRALSFIRKKVSAPVFVFFCDPGSVEWCKENPYIFGLNFEKDKVEFVDWNLGTDSYRDMQLMTDCKHNIITNSSFGWWGAYLNDNPDKITISPDARINTTHWV